MLREDGEKVGLGEICDAVKDERGMQKFRDSLVKRLKAGKSISDSPMYDGFIIAFIITFQAVEHMILNDRGAYIKSDLTLEICANVGGWLIANKVEILKILTDEKQ